MQKLVFLAFEMESRYMQEIIFEGDVFADMLDPNWVDSNTSGPPLRLNHYKIQSRDFFETMKMKRGAADVPENYDLRTEKIYSLF